MINDFFSKQFILFLLTSGTAALANFCSRWIYNQWIDFSFAIIFAYLTGMVTAFILAKLFVFKQSQNNIQRSAWIFTLVNLAAVIQTWAASMALAFYVFPWMEITSFVPEISHGIGIIIPVFTSFIGHKHWTFK